jgi:hypothetical protein
VGGECGVVGCGERGAGSVSVQSFCVSSDGKMEEGWKSRRERARCRTVSGFCGSGSRVEGVREWWDVEGK